MNMNVSGSRTIHYEKKTRNIINEHKRVVHGGRRHLRRWEAVDQWAAECRKQLM